MNRFRLKILPLLLLASGLALADPIHAVADGAYWHHDSGFVFVPKVGEFVLVGIPQDVAGSREAVAYYARGAGDERTVAAVDVYPADSAQPLDESSTSVDLGEGLRAARNVLAAPAAKTQTIRYFVAKGDWCIRIEVTVPVADADTLSSIDAFVKGQRWKSLASN